MNFSGRGFSNNKNGKLNFPSKVTALNPNAAVFVPSAFRSQVGNTESEVVTRSHVPVSSAKSALGRLESNISNNSDDEAHQFWRHQLPDDITPDFTSMREDDLHTSGDSLASLSLHDGIKISKFPPSGSDQIFGTRDMPPRGIGNLNSGAEVGYPISNFMQDQSSNPVMKFATPDWDNQFMNVGDHFTIRREGQHYGGDPTARIINDSISEHETLEYAGINPVEFLASEFSGFAAESLADVYYANGCDLNSTIEMLTQLEPQVDANISQDMNSEASKAPTFNMIDFPSLSAAETQNGMSKFNGEAIRQASNLYRSSSISRGTTDFASTVRKLAAQDSAHRKYERSGAVDGNIGTSKNSQIFSSYNVNGKVVYGDKVRSAAAVRDAPVWLETGEAVGNMYTELREDARDFARLRNACFEQARQAYLIGNGALARELSRKGQLYNMQMKEAHGKARETINHQRNPAALPEARMQDRLIDLHGLHVSEAIHVLEHELSILRSTARSAGQRLQVMIFVGTGGVRTPARLPVAVEQFLLEEGLLFTQPQPGLLHVVIY